MPSDKKVLLGEESRGISDRNIREESHEEYPRGESRGISTRRITRNIHEESHGE